MIQELAWRDYWQQVAITKRDFINNDLKHPQTEIHTEELSSAISSGKTGIIAIDKAINNFYETGYLHNHVRMYVASISCNIARNHWQLPAKWMYYNLLDADWASNNLSWQWVCGANSHKKYFANQENISKYCGTDQHNTFLDHPYDKLPYLDVPKALIDTNIPSFENWYPTTETIKIDKNKPTYIYNFYNLDPVWDKDIDANRILLLEPSHFLEYPVSQKVLSFVLELANNIDGVQIYVAEFDSVLQLCHQDKIYFKEHPLFNHYKGNKVSRDWMTDVTGYYPSFFKFWDRVKKQLFLSKYTL